MVCDVKLWPGICFTASEFFSSICAHNLHCFASISTFVEPIQYSSNPNAGAGTATTGGGSNKDKKNKDKGGKDKGAAQSKSAPGSIDPYASFDCKEDSRFKAIKCDVVLIAANNKHCPSTYPNALAKGSFTEWQWNKSTGVTDAIDFDIECCGAYGCTPAMASEGKYVIQQLPDGKNKVVPGLRVYGPAADPVADGEQSVIIRMGGGLK